MKTEGKITVAIFIIVLAGMLFSFFLPKSDDTKIAQRPSKSPVKLLSIFHLPITESSNDILEDIRKARQMLEKKEFGFEVQEKKGRWKIKDLRVLLAVKRAGRIELVTVDPKKKQIHSQDYEIFYTRANGVNTDFTVRCPKDCVVLAIKRVVRDDEDMFKEIIYTPYSPAIDCKLLRDAGLSYLNGMIGMARVQLEDIPSQSNPKLSVIDAAPANLSLTLAIIEHIDPARVQKGEDIEQLINEILVVIGANKHSAYKYSISTANARGLFQFIPRTYGKMREEYPAADLLPDFIQGMNDHLNAAKASLLLFDSDRTYLKSRRIWTTESETLGKHLASSYNCGAKRTARAIKTKKDFWELKVPKETRMYLKKFAATWKIMNGG